MRLLLGRLSRFKHLSDETISRLIAGELPTVHAFGARSHIDLCWRCRSRREAFERAAMQVTEHRNRLVKTLPTNPHRRSMLLAELRRKATEDARLPFWTRSLFEFNSWVGNRMSPILASAAIVSAAAFLLILVWQRAARPMSANQLLQRAVASESAAAKDREGAIYQKVRIATAGEEIEHEIYRDPRGIRQRYPEPIKRNAKHAQDVLARAGVEWDKPLSPGSFRKWHDVQASVKDEVRSEDGNLLTLVSTGSDGSIRKESLTVRTSDFHAVARSIESRTDGTIEIAELSYAVLPWSGINESLFQPLSAATRETPLILHSLPSQDSLDSAELSAMLVLNQLHADNGEQINVTRTDSAVEVKGVVETDERKQEIVRKLYHLKHVHTDILSITELQLLPRNGGSTQPITAGSVDVWPSPLAEYLDARGDRKEEISDASQRLLDAALDVSRNASKFTALQKRFPDISETSPNWIVVGQLSQSYSVRLAAGLEAEKVTLAALGFADHAQPELQLSVRDLQQEIDRNDALCRELIAGKSGSSRTAREIAVEIYDSIDKIRAAMKTQGGAKTGGQ